MSEFGEIGPDELDLLEDSIDDQLLLDRIKNVMLGNDRPDPEGETLEEQSELILRTVLRQLQSGSPSRAALGYVAKCLERRLTGEVATLDEAFYVRNKRQAGGQGISAEGERATVRAFMRVIRRTTWKFDSSIGCYIYSVPSKTTLREAYQAAYVAYRKAVGKERVVDDEPEKRINQTIKPILRRLGVFMLICSEI
jgi:hypothetical protein